MIKMNKKIKKLISFFDKTGYYDERCFNYILNHTNISEEDDYKKFGSINNYIKEDLKNNKLKDFYITIPKITDEKTMLICIYIIAHALNKYKNLGKEIKHNNLEEVLPVSLVRIYSVLYGDKRLQMKISSWQEEKITNDCLEELLIAYDLQFMITGFFINTNIILIPNTYFIDDMKKAKREIRNHLWTTMELDKSKTKK